MPALARCLREDREATRLVLQTLFSQRKGPFAADEDLFHELRGFARDPELQACLTPTIPALPNETHDAIFREFREHLAKATDVAAILPALRELAKSN